MPLFIDQGHAEGKNVKIRYSAIWHILIRIRIHINIDKGIVKCHFSLTEAMPMPKYVTISENGRNSWIVGLQPYGVFW